MLPLVQVIEYYTYDDYKEWEGKWELIDGIPLAIAPAPMRIHQSLQPKEMKSISLKFMKKRKLTTIS